MGKSIYLETSSGISGDMFVAAMLDLGADVDVLAQALNSIPADGFSVEVSRVQKSGIDCCDFNVILDAEHENHDHDMAYLYGTEPVAAAPAEEHHCHCHEDSEEEHHHCHDEGEEHHHCHCHDEGEEEHHHCHCHDEGEEEHHHCHCHEEGKEEHHHCHCHEEGEEEHHHCHHHAEGHHHHGGHVHRHLADVQVIIEGTDMTASAKALANRIFRIVAEAESKAHNLPLEEVHFHEVGAIDSIVDIIAAAVCFDDLGISDVIVPKLTEGTGTVRCQHGVLPVPVPATLHIVEDYGMPLEIMNAKGEYVTPTGAAIAAALCTTHTLPASFRVLATGLGAGKRAYTERTNILRAYLIESGDAEEKDEVVKIETDIDDCTGEALGYTMEKLLEAGALDVHYTPIYMKKNRPAWELTVICKKDQMEVLEDIIFRETTTIGIREFTSVMRSVLHRRQVQVETPYGTAEAKQVSLHGEDRFYPEYESVKKLAEENGRPFAEIYDSVKAAAEKK